MIVIIKCVIIKDLIAQVAHWTVDKVLGKWLELSVELKIWLLGDPQ
jgi:hypothetical protein